MKTIKIAYMDFWPGFEPNSCIFNKILSKYYNIEISEKPDYVFCSLYSFDCLKSDAVRIFYTGDNYTPDFNIYDYALAFDYITFNDRYLRVPNYFINLKYEKAVDLMLHKHENVTDKDFDERKFCSWVCSNGNGNPLRERLFNYISTYNIVDSGGRFLNNIGKPNGVDDKIKFQNNYKFSFALEDSENPGYLDEKLIQCFASKTIPIFWGDETVSDFFNTKSMINVHDFKTNEELLQEIIKVNTNKDLYLEKLRTPALIKADYIDETYKLLEEFLLHIFEQPLSNAKRVGISPWHIRQKKLMSQSVNVSRKLNFLGLFKK